MSKVTCAIVALVTLLVVLACAAACLAVAGVIAYSRVESGGAAQVSETIASEVAVDSPATLVVRNPAGNVTIRTGQRGRVQVEAAKEADSMVGAQTDRLLESVEVRSEAGQPLRSFLLGTDAAGAAHPLGACVRGATSLGRNVAAGTFGTLGRLCCVV